MGADGAEDDLLAAAAMAATVAAVVSGLALFLLCAPQRVREVGQLRAHVDVVSQPPRGLQRVALVHRGCGHVVRRCGAVVRRGGGGGAPAAVQLQRDSIVISVEEAWTSVSGLLGRD